jgi:LysR family glycine cleavage system transcriptional activator
MADRPAIAGLPPLVWLRAFEAAARTESFTAAARELAVTQAAISYQVRSLEERLGCVLFDRLPRGVRLTAMGLAYLAPVRKAFDDLAISTVGLFGAHDKASITVLAPVSFAALWLAPQLPDFLARHPAINVRLSATIWGTSGGDAATDLEIRYGDGAWNGHIAAPLFHQDLVVACSPALARRAATDDLAALVDGRMIHIMGHENHWAKLGRAISAGAGPTVDTTVAALELAAAGAGCVITHPLFLAGHLATGRLVVPFAESVPDDQGFHLLTPERPQRTPREVHLFRLWLHEAAARMHESPA